jgi:hypothetical protein
MPHGAKSANRDNEMGGHRGMNDTAPSRRKHGALQADSCSGRRCLPPPRRDHFGLVWSASVLTAVLLLVGPGAAAAAELAPVGYRTVTVESGGFRLAIPSTWLALELSEPLPPDADARFIRQVSDARTVPDARFIATDPGSVDHAVVQVFARMRSLVWTLLRDQLGREHFQHLTPERSQVAGQPAIIVRIIEDHVVTQTFLTFYFVRGRRGVIGFAFITRQDGRRDPVEQTMIHNIELLSRAPKPSSASARS